jgi:hypothetical protein
MLGSLSNPLKKMEDLLALIINLDILPKTRRCQNKIFIEGKSHWQSRRISFAKAKWLIPRKLHFG